MAAGRHGDRPPAASPIIGRDRPETERSTTSPGRPHVKLGRRRAGAVHGGRMDYDGRPAGGPRSLFLRALCTSLCLPAHRTDVCVGNREAPAHCTPDRAPFRQSSLGAEHAACMAAGSRSDRRSSCVRCLPHPANHGHRWLCTGCNDCFMCTKICDSVSNHLRRFFFLFNRRLDLATRKLELRFRLALNFGTSSSK